MIEIITAVNNVLYTSWTPAGKRKLKESDYVNYAIAVVALHNEGGDLEQIAEYLCAKGKQQKGTEVKYAALEIARKVIDAIGAATALANNSADTP